MGNLTLNWALTIDGFTVAICLAVALREARSVLHPAWMFLGLHAYIVTSRLIQVYTGSNPMRATFAWPVTVDELIRAGVSSDLGLLAIAVGWIVARFIVKHRQLAKPDVRVVSEFRVRLVASAAMAIGVFAILLSGSNEHGLQNASWDTSGYLAATTSWPSWSVCLLHFLYGFPGPLLIVTSAVLTFVGLTNSRFAVVIPIILLSFIWLSRRRGRGIPLTMVAVILGAWVIWLPMKPFKKSLHEGAGVKDALNEALEYAYTDYSKAEGSVDEQFLDMVAATMTLSDLHGSWYWGSTIAPLLTGPVPRLLWPEKPKMNQYQWDLQVPARNLADLGMTAGLVAEGYVNFGYVGVVLYCFGVSFAFAFAYFRVAKSNRKSPSLLLYLFCLASAAQVYRDGLISAVWFPFVYAAPIGWTAVSHWIWKPGRRRTRLPLRRTPNETVAQVR